MFTGDLKRIRRTTLSDVYLFTHVDFTLDDWVPTFVLRHSKSPFVLPKQVVIKQYNVVDHNQGDIDDLHFEQEAYRKLGPLQGRVVPCCYGEVLFREKPAIAIQYIRGCTLWDIRKSISTANLSVTDICKGISQCFEEISKYSVAHGDVDPTKLDNLMLGQLSKSWVILSGPILFIGFVIGASASLRPQWGLSMLMDTCYMVRDFAAFTY
jgi:hypothetical protein